MTWFLKSRSGWMACTTLAYVLLWGAFYFATGLGDDVLGAIFRQLFVCLAGQAFGLLWILYFSFSEPWFGRWKDS